VLELIREGKTNSEIAYALSISIPGVKWHVSNMLGKLGVADRHQLAAWKGHTGSAAAGRPGSRAGTAGFAGWFGWKAALGAAAGLVAGGAIVAAALVGSTDDSPPPAAVTPALPQPPTSFVATVEFADALSTKVRLDLELASPPTDDYMLSIEDGFAIYADGDRSRDYALTMGLLEGGPNSGNRCAVAIEFDAVPAGTQFIEVELNGKLRRVAMSQAEADRQKTPGAQYFAAVPPGTSARAAVVRDPVEVDLTDRAPKEFDSGLGWKYVFERVVATSTRLGVTYHVEGLADGWGYHDLGGHSNVDGSLRFRPGQETAVVNLPTAGQTVKFAVGPGSRWVEEPIRATFTRSGATWTPWSGLTGIGQLDAALTDAPKVTMNGSAEAILFGVPVTLSDDLGHTYQRTGSHGGPALMEMVFEGPLDPAAKTVTLNIEGYWVAETREWTVEIPVR
jgi:hypothetical protein